jgi:hypothetical protein
MGLQDMPDRPHQFIVEQAVLALEVQHGYRLGGWERVLRRVRCVFHTTMLPVSRLAECRKRGMARPAAWIPRSQTRDLGHPEESGK